MSTSRCASGAAATVDQKAAADADEDDTDDDDEVRGEAEDRMRRQQHGRGRGKVSARWQAQVNRVASVPPHTIVNQIAHQTERRERGIRVDALRRKHKHTVRPRKHTVPRQQVEKVIVDELHRVECGSGHSRACTLARAAAMRQ